MRLTWNNISLEVPHGKEYRRILNSVCGSAESGRLMAFMGPSGCGKTTFLNVLSGNVPYSYKTNGEVLLDGQEIDKNSVSLITYLQQDDFYLEYYKVYEFVEFNALGRNKDKPIEKIREEIDDLLKKLFLSEKKDVCISKLSGGERKRLLIANEIMGNSQILFLDEPTTGLDSHLALELIYFLGELAKEQNKLVITTIHQPSIKILNMFQDFAFIYKGKMIYCGPYKECEKIFSDNGMTKPEDLSFAEYLFLIGADDAFIPQVRKDIPVFKKWVEEIKEQPFAIEKSNKSVPNTKGTTNFKTFRMVPYYVKRQFKYCLSNQYRTKFLTKSISILAYYLLLALPVLIYSPDNAVSRAVLRILFIYFLSIGSLSLFSSSFQEINTNKVENTKLYFTFVEWLLGVALFQASLYFVSIFVITLPLFFFRSLSFSLRLIGYSIVALPLSFIQSFFLVSILSYDVLLIIIQIIMLFPNYALFSTIPIFNDNKVIFSPLALVIQAFPMNLFCVLIDLMEGKVSINRGNIANGDVVNKISIAMTNLEWIGIGIYAYLFISICFTFLLIFVSYWLLKRKISSPLRLNLEKKSKIN